MWPIAPAKLSTNRHFKLLATCQSFSETMHVLLNIHERYNFVTNFNHLHRTFYRMARKNQSSLLLTNKQRCTITLPALEFPVRDLVHCKMAALPRGNQVSLSTFLKWDKHTSFSHETITTEGGKTLVTHASCNSCSKYIQKIKKGRESEGSGQGY